MAVIDTKGSEIVWLKNFPNDDTVENIEFGAGTSYFGKKYFPLCYLTDVTNNNLKHFFGINDYDSTNCHYLDHICDFNKIDFQGRTFNKVIFCNPSDLGFRGREFSKEFLNKTANILSDNGSIIIIGNSTNPWSKYHNVKRYLERLTNDGELISQFIISDLIVLDDTHEYRKNVFTHSDINTVAYPNELFTITKNSHD